MLSVLPYLYIAICIAAFVEATPILIQRTCGAGNQAFLIFIGGTGIWIGGMSILLLTRSFVLIHVVNIGSLLAVIGITWFSYSFPEQGTYPVPPWVFWAPLFLGGAYLICNRQIIGDMVFPDNSVSMTPGARMPIWALLLLAYMFLAALRFYRSFRTVAMDDGTRIFLTYICIWALLSFSFVLIVLLPGSSFITGLNALGLVSAAVFLCAIAYNLGAKTFPGIQLLIQRGLIYTVCYALIASVCALFLVLIDLLFVQITHVAYSIVASLTILIGVYTFPRIEAFFRNVTDPLFFKKHYSYSNTLEQLTQVLNEHLDLRSLVMHSLLVLEKTFRPRYAYFIHIDSIQCSSHAVCTCKRPTRANQSDVQVPIRSDQELVGTFLLGKRKSGDKYTLEDMALLRAFERTASISFEKSRLYEQLRRYTEGLETDIKSKATYLELLRQQQEFFNDISHALQTPLTVLSGNLELLSGMRGAEEPCRNIHKAYSDISRLVQSILRIARVENQLSNEVAPLDLSELVSQIVHYVRIIADMEKVRLSLHISPNCLVTGSRAQLEEAVTNILSNAIKYTSGCAQKRVEILLTRGNVLHELQVSDTGIGMTKEQTRHIFERYYRASQTTRQKGHGLGLAITKRIIGRHRGTIAIDSQIGAGTRVLIFIPAANQEHARS